MSAKSWWNGYIIEFVGDEWRFCDSGKPTVGSNRPCGHCQCEQTEEGHDGCLGTLPGVMNACCGHGQISDAYLQYPDGTVIYGQNAVDCFQKLLRYSNA